MAKENEIKEAKGIIVPIVWAFLLFVILAGGSINYALSVSGGGKMLSGLFLGGSIFIFCSGMVALNIIYRKPPSNNP